MPSIQVRPHLNTVQEIKNLPSISYVALLGNKQLYIFESSLHDLHCGGIISGW